jgi:glycosyltransferase involved in cell wall biosynthesis
MELTCQTPVLRAVFAPDEAEALFRLLSASPLQLVMIHQLLGYQPDVLHHLTHLAATTHAVFYAHDFYAFCPRVTMIDATGQFCRAANVDICTRCISSGGGHEASQLQTLTPPEHRALFEHLLQACRQIVAPSESAAAYFRSTFPTLNIQAIPHPDHARTFPPAARTGSDDEIILLGAIGPHKGSVKLLEIARQALLSHPHLRFRVIGYTDIDRDLLSLGNVEITGKYAPSELTRLSTKSHGRLALFLSGWPETYSYTLSEAVSLGFIPLVPDLGALAERVSARGFGLVFPFPIDPMAVLDLISRIARGEVPLMQNAASPAAYQTDPATLESSRQVLSPTQIPQANPTDTTPPRREPIRRRNPRRTAAE